MNCHPDTEQQYLDALSSNFPNGYLFRFQIEARLLEQPAANGIYPAMDCIYLSPSWEQVSGISREESKKDFAVVFMKAHFGGVDELIRNFYRCLVNCTLFNAEVHCCREDGKEYWLQFATQPRRESNVIVCDGFALDITSRKQTELELENERERLQSFSNNFSDGALYRLVYDTVTGERRTTWLSDNWERITGICNTSAIEDVQQLDRSIHPDDMPFLIEQELKSLETMSNFNCELRMASKNGLRWAQLISRPHRKGNLVIWDGIMLDITERKQIEQNLVAEKNRLEALGNNLPLCALYRLELDAPDSPYRVTYLSANWEKTVGVSIAESTHDFGNIFKVMHPADIQRFIECESECFKQMRDFSCEVRLHVDDKWRWVMVVAHPHTENRHVIWDGLVLDITERKHAEQQLLEESNRIEALGSNIHNGSLVRCEINADELKRLKTPADILKILNLTYASNSWGITSGVPKEEAIKNISTALSKIHEDDQTALFGEIYHAIVERRAMDMEARYHYSLSETRWIRISVSARDEGAVIVCDGFVFNVTQRKNTELEMAAYRDRLELLVKQRTEELETVNEELTATNEELANYNAKLNAEIAARVNAMQQLQISEEKMQNFIKQSFEGIVMFDSEGRIIEWNRAMERITGLTAEDTLGRYEWDVRWMLFPREERTAWALEDLHRRRLEFMLSELPPIITELNVQSLDGTIRYTRASTFQVQTTGGKFFGRIVRDNTRQRHVELELTRYRMNLEQMVVSQTKELRKSNERLTTLSNNLPGGVIYQMQDSRNGAPGHFTYVSTQFAEMFGINAKDVLNDSSLFFGLFHPEDVVRLVEYYSKADDEGMIDSEYRIVFGEDNFRWIHIRVAYHTDDEGIRTWDGFMIDITERKTADLNLEELRRQQAILIKVLQTVQSIGNMSDVINTALSEIGKYAGVSRAYIFEKAPDGKTVNNVYEWCGEGVTSEIDNLQGVPIECVSKWFDMFENGEYICASDIRDLSPLAIEKLEPQGIKSIVVLPLKADSVVYGFVGFDECTKYHTWQRKEVELLISLSQIISTTTTRFRARKAIQLSQQTMRTVLDNIGAAIYVAAFDTYELLFANKTVKKMMGDDIEGKPCWQVMQKDMTGPCPFCPNRQLLGADSKPAGIYRWEFQNSNTGRWFECTDAAIEWVDGRTVHMEYATDITDRRNAEDAVRRSEQMYRRLTEASPDAVMLCDTQGKIIIASSKARELYRVNGDKDFAGLSITDFTHSDCVEQAAHVFCTFVEGGRDWPALLQMHSIRFDGSDFYSEISSALVKDIEGNTVSVIMVIRDITDRLRAEAELVLARDKAEESDRLKSAFLANLSHEIRTPLNGIAGLLNILAADPELSAAIRENIGIINDNSEHLIALIDDVLDLARLETGQMTVHPEPVCIAGMMNDLNRRYTQRLLAEGKAHIALEYSVDGVVAAHADPKCLRQILNRLLSNAVKFTECGHIRFGCRLQSADMLEFFVEDTGIGIPESQMDVIFQSFRQADLSNSRHYGGLGLGLSISRGLARLMGGCMSAESVEGKGSTFVFTIAYKP